MLMEDPRQAGSAEEIVMRPLARCVRHRLVVPGIWLMVLADAFFGQSALGSHYAIGLASRRGSR
jgi:hypothetical protein